MLNRLHPYTTILTYIIFIVLNLFSSSIYDTLILFCIIFYLLLVSKYSLSSYFIAFIRIFPYILIMVLFPNIFLKIVNIILYGIFITKNISVLSLFEICYKLNFYIKDSYKRRKKTCFLLNKIYNFSLSKIRIKQIYETYKMRISYTKIDYFSFYKIVKNNLKYDILFFCEDDIKNYEEKRRQDNLFHFSTFDIIFIVFHVIIIIVVGGI